MTNMARLSQQKCIFYFQKRVFKPDLISTHVKKAIKFFAIVTWRRAVYIDLQMCVKEHLFPINP